MKKINPNEHLDYILKNTTPYQRMRWLKVILTFWRFMQLPKNKQITTRR